MVLRYLERCGVALLAAALLLSAPAVALRTGGEIDLAWALQRTLETNPTLAAFPYRLRRGEGLLAQAGLRPQARIGLVGENLAGSGDYRGTERAEFTLALSQRIELGRKRARRLAVAEAALGSERADYELARLDTLAETLRRYYQVLRWQALAAWIAERSGQEQQALAVIEQRARAGAVGRAEVSKMALRLARSRALQEQLGGELALARTRLASMWLERPTFAAVVGDLAALPPLPAEAAVLDALEDSPRLLRQSALRRLAEERVALAEANGRLDLRLGVGLRHFQDSDDQALVFDVSAPLALRNPNRGRIAAAQAERELSWQQAEAEHGALRLALLELWQMLDNRRGAARQLDQHLLPLARTQLVETERGFGLGHYSVLQWVDAQRELYALQRELIETRLAIHLNLLELERITGQPLAGVGTGETS